MSDLTPNIDGAILSARGEYNRGSRIVECDCGESAEFAETLTKLRKTEKSRGEQKYYQIDYCPCGVKIFRSKLFTEAEING